MKIALIDYGAGNLHSAAKAIERAAAEAGLGVSLTMGSDRTRWPRQIASCCRAMGPFRDCMSNLLAVDGLLDALTEAVKVRGRPFLGICVGMQLLATRGLEHGETAGLGWIPGEVRRIAPARPGFKVPHMGWNTLYAHRDHALLSGVKHGPDGLHAYSCIPTSSLPMMMPISSPKRLCPADHRHRREGQYCWRANSIPRRARRLASLSCAIF